MKLPCHCKYWIHAHQCSIKFTAFNVNHHGTPLSSAMIIRLIHRIIEPKIDSLRNNLISLQQFTNQFSAKNSTRCETITKIINNYSPTSGMGVCVRVPASKRRPPVVHLADLARWHGSMLIMAARDYDDYACRLFCLRLSRERNFASHAFPSSEDAAR